MVTAGPPNPPIPGRSASVRKVNCLQYPRNGNRIAASIRSRIAYLPDFRLEAVGENIDGLELVYAPSRSQFCAPKFCAWVLPKADPPGPKSNFLVEED